MSRSSRFDWFSRNGKNKTRRTRKRDRKLRQQSKLQMESLEARQLMTTTVGFTGDYAVDKWTLNLSNTGLNDRASIAPDSGPAAEITLQFSQLVGNAVLTAPSTVTGTVRFDYTYVDGSFAPTMFSTLSGATADEIGVLRNSPTPVSASFLARTGQEVGFRLDGTDIDFDDDSGGWLTLRNFVAHDSIIVDSTADGLDGNYSRGEVTLREAVEWANEAPGVDTITFDPTIFDGELGDVIRLQAPINIKDAVYIDGGAQQVVISGDASGDDQLVAGTMITSVFESEAAGLLNDNVRVIDIAPGVTDVTLTGLTITGGGSGQSGGGISSQDSNLVIEASSISGNRAISGGGIYATRGNLSVTDSEISGNRSLGNGGGVWVGIRET